MRGAIIGRKDCGDPSQWKGNWNRVKLLWSRDAQEDVGSVSLDRADVGKRAASSLIPT